jgi:hypothetical protein
MGGLGNQLFQIFTTISYAIQTRNVFYFYEFEFTGGVGTTNKRETYWNNFLSKLKLFLRKEFPPLKIIQETNFTFNQIPLTNIIGKDICLHGYFQSYKYFQSTYKTIYRLLNIDEHKKNVIKLVNDVDDTVSIHFRLGDYKKLQDMHPLITDDYYKQALEYIFIHTKNVTSVLFFCEDEDIDEITVRIHNLQLLFPLVEFNRASNNLKDWEQMILMSCCKYNIIANSSFSWWAAYLNSNEDKIVCYPSTWFGSSLSHDTKDLCPEEWIKI